ncbi:hypothetical protein HYU22_01940 [Candidatus Woesearchaeota archaeon]|nr:hypothetical protein [Candidatus Woesearchaeota archaeon]
MVRLNTKLDGLLVEGMPTDYQLRKLVKDQSADIFYAFASIERASCRLYVGPKNKLEEVQVKEISNLRDGGTILVGFNLEGKVGELSFPPKYRDPATVKYQGRSRIELQRII